MKSTDVYRIIRICLNPNTLMLHCDVYVDGFDHADSISSGDKATNHTYNLPSGYLLKKLDDSIYNRFVITKRIDIYNPLRRTIICIGNTFDKIGDGNCRIVDGLEVGKEYTVLPQTGANNGEFIHIEELPSANGYPVSLFEEKDFYCEDTLLDFKKECLLKALERSEEDVRQGRVRTIEGLFQGIKDSVYETNENTDRDRIQGYIDTISRVWSKHYGLRFGQLIQYSLMDQKLWDIDDEKLFKALAKYE